MKKRLLFSLLVLSSLLSQAQLPEFYNSAVTATSNTYPLASASFNKAQWIFGPNQFNAGGTGVGAAAYFGNISKIYLKLGNSVAPSSTYTNFTISLSQNVGTSTSFGTGSGGGVYSFVTGMTQCFYQASGFALTGAAVNSWYAFNLNGSFPYNPNLSLVVEIKVSGGSGNRISLMAPSSAPRRLFGGYSSASATTATEAPNFGINMIQTPLPVNVSSFTGFKEGGSDMLKWSTSCETNNAYFNLQHSTDGVNFTTLEKINSKAVGGTCSGKLDYDGTNVTPSLGHNYYKLEQVDINGTMSYNSKVIDLVRSSDGSIITLYPNPSKDIANIDLLVNDMAHIVIKIQDMNGRIVKQIQTDVQKGMNTIPVQISELPNGIYIAQVIQQDKIIFSGGLRKE